jgi:hypothetical protein
VSAGVFARIREACARVAQQARSVRIDPGRVEALGVELSERATPADREDPARRKTRDAQTTLAYVFALDAINFGSGWFPVLKKRPGMSGYFTVATSLEEHFAAQGAWSAEQLSALDAEACARVFGQDSSSPDAAELMSLFARSLNDLGRFLVEGYAGRFEGPLRAAGGSAARLVELLASMPLYRDVARYRGFEVPFYKRAQITVADLAAGLGGCGLGRFEDVDDLTLFADNLVPHVLRCEGVLHYTPELGRRIDAGELIAAGSPDEVEIRACAVHAVEGCTAAARRAGRPASARHLDWLLWHRGQCAEIKTRPRHRTRTPYY